MASIPMIEDYCNEQKKKRMSKWWEEIRCLRCNIRIYGASGMMPDEPSDGEACICFACGNLMIFDAKCFDQIKLTDTSVQQKLDIRSNSTEYQRGVLDTLEYWWRERSKSSYEQTSVEKSAS